MKPAKTRCGGQWTEAKFWGYIRSGLRRIWMRWPEQYRARENARRPYNGTNKNQKWEFQCAACDGWVMGKNTNAHHKIECGSIKRYADLGPFVERMLCPAEGIQILCKPCHKKLHKETKTNKT